MVFEVEGLFSDPFNNRIFVPTWQKAVSYPKLHFTTHVWQSEKIEIKRRSQEDSNTAFPALGGHLSLSNDISRADQPAGFLCSILEPLSWSGWVGRILFWTLIPRIPHHHGLGNTSRGFLGVIAPSPTFPNSDAVPLFLLKFQNNC